MLPNTKSKAQCTMEKFLQETLELSPEEVKKLSERYKKGEFEYLLTFDMGCGNTSAAIISLTASAVRQMIVWPKANNPRSGAVATETILGRYGEDFYYGDLATRFRGYVENFKVIPGKKNLDATKYYVGSTESPMMTLREAWTKYFEMTLSNALYYASDFAQKISAAPVKKENTILLVAHPAGEAWSNELLNYRAMIMDATKLPPEQVITFSEAKASMMYARQKGKNGRFILQGGVDSLVIDLGASTIDILHIDAQGAPKKEFSISFAGRNVDEIIGYNILKELYPNEMKAQPKNKIPNSDFFRNNKLLLDRAGFKYAVRHAKEGVCDPSEKGEDAVCSISVARGKIFMLKRSWIFDLLKKQVVCVSGVDMEFAQFMDPNANANSVTGTWNEILTQVVAYNAKGMSPRCQIIVSGGTANLVGVEECVRAGALQDGIGVPQLVVLNHPDDYNSTVPMGSGDYMLRVLKNLDTLEKFPQELTAIISSWLKDCAVLCLAAPITTDAIKKMNDILRTWANAQGEDTINNLVAQIKNSVTYNQDEIDTLVTEGLRYHLVDDVRMPMQRLKDDLDEACDDLLKKISPNNKAFGMKIETPDWYIDTASVEAAVKRAVSNIDWVSMLPGLKRFLGSLGNFFGGNNNNDTTRLKQKDRKAIYDKFKQKPPRFTISGAIEGQLSRTLTKQCTKDGFGIPGKVMEELKPLLGLAMFQQADLAEKEDTVVFTN